MFFKLKQKVCEQTEKQHEDLGVHQKDYSLFEEWSFNAFFSWVSNQTLISSPFPPIYDPLSPELRSTRWHGTISGIWENNREKDASDEVKYFKINQSFMINHHCNKTHRVFLHGWPHGSHSIWIPDHFSKLLVRDRLPKPHFLQQSPQHMCCKRIWEIARERIAVKNSGS